MGSQATHTAPAGPQADSDGVVHVDPEQQPVGHEVASQPQPPSLHVLPAGHAEPVPHRHSPAAQLSVVSGEQATQTSPPVPQLASPLGLQVTPSQQPLGHEVASHTQLPPRHRCPAAHAGPVPHAQAPPTQASANTGSQAMQAAPAVPHATEEGSLHIEPEQQPVGHPAAQVSQTPPTQSPPPQLSQLPPPAPHALGVSPG